MSEERPTEGSFEEPDKTKLGTPPGFDTHGTRFSVEAERELRRKTADFESKLRNRALEKGETFDQIQSAHVQEAHDELVATKIDVIADLGIAVGLPTGYLFIGVVINDLLKFGTVPLQPLTVILAGLGGAIVGSSLLVNAQRYRLKRHSKKKKDARRAAASGRSAPDHVGASR